MNTYGLVLITYMGFSVSLGNNHRLPQPLIVQTQYERSELQRIQPQAQEVRQNFSNEFQALRNVKEKK